MNDYSALLKEPLTYSLFDVDSTVTATETYLCLTTTVSESKVISYLKDTHREVFGNWATEPTEVDTVVTYVVHPDAPHREAYHQNAEGLLGKLAFEHHLLHLDNSGDSEGDISAEDARTLISTCLAGRHGPTIPASLLTGYLMDVSSTSSVTTRVLAASEQEAHDMVAEILTETEPSIEDVETTLEPPERVDPEDFIYFSGPVYRSANSSISDNEAVALIGKPVMRFDPNQLSLDFVDLI